MNARVREVFNWVARAEEAKLSRLRLAGVRCTRFCWMLGEHFVRDRCMQKSAALTYTTILSLFPFLVVISLFAAHFYPGGPEKIQQNVIDILQEYVLPPTETSGSPAAETPIAETIKSVFLQFQSKTGTLAGLGAVGLLLSAIVLFTSSEKFFNEIFRVPAKRPLLRMFSAFASILVSLPILVSIATLVSSFFQGQMKRLETFEYVGGFVRVLIGTGAFLLPFLMISLALAAVLFLIPNTRVHLRSALAGGLLSGLLWVLVKKGFALYMRFSPLKTSIFGAFAAPLVFLMWLYLLWAIVLIGAETAYLSQHYGHVVRERFGSLHYTLDDPRLYVLVLGRVAEAFLRDEGGVEFHNLRAQTTLADSDLENALRRLRESRFLAVRDDGKWILERPPDHIRLNDIFQLGCSGAALTRQAGSTDRLLTAMTELDRALSDRCEGKTLRDLIEGEAE